MADPRTTLSPQQADIPICPKCGAAIYSVKHVTECSKEVPRQSRTTVRAPFRLAMRAEGAFWNAYLAHSDTMAESMLLGSIRLAAVQEPDRKARFMALMQESLAAALMDTAGVTISWPDPPKTAPEHERNGSA